MDRQKRIAQKICAGCGLLLRCPSACCIFKFIPACRSPIRLYHNASRQPASTLAPRPHTRRHSEGPRFHQRAEESSGQEFQRRRSFAPPENRLRSEPALSEVEGMTPSKVKHPIFKTAPRSYENHFFVLFPWLCDAGEELCFCCGGGLAGFCCCHVLNFRSCCCSCSGLFSCTGGAGLAKGCDQFCAG